MPPLTIPDIVLRLARREITSGAAPAADPLAVLQRDVAPGWPELDQREAPDEDQTPLTNESPANELQTIQRPPIEPQVDANLPGTGASRWSSPGHTLRELALGPAATDAIAGALADGQAVPSRMEDRGWKIADDEPGASPSSNFDPPSSTSLVESAVVVRSNASSQTNASWQFAPPPESGTTSSPPGPGRSASVDSRQQPGTGASPGDAGADRISESVADQARRLEQLSCDLDSSLTRLFATQLETLDHLRQRLDDHERLWLEQQAVRRAGL